TGQILLVSAGTDGTQGNTISTQPYISADGRYVAFKSDATNLVSGDTNGTTDVFVKDMQTGQLIRVNTDSSGVQANGYGDNPRLSADGRYVAFISSATNLVAGDSNGVDDIFVKDLLTGQTRIGSTSSSGAQSDALCDMGGMSADGRYLSFGTMATTLVSGD